MWSFRGKKQWDTGCRYFALAHSTPIHSPGSPLSLRLWPSAEPEAGKRECCHCLVETRRTTCAYWNSYFKCPCSVAQSCPTLWDPMDCSTPGFPVLHHLPELVQTRAHWVSNAIQPTHPLSSPSPPAFNLPQHQDLFQWVRSLHQVAKVLEFQLQHQSVQWIFRTDFF